MRSINWWVPAASCVMLGAWCVLHMVVLHGAVSWFRNGVLRVLAGAWNITSSYPKIRLQSGGYRPWTPHYQPQLLEWLSAYLTLCSPPYVHLLMATSRSYRSKKIHPKFRQRISQTLWIVFTAQIREKLVRRRRNNFVTSYGMLMCTFVLPCDRMWDGVRLKNKK